MQGQRRHRVLHCHVLAWLMVSLGVVIVSPLIKPQAMEMVCSFASSAKLIVVGDNDSSQGGEPNPVCPLCGGDKALLPRMPAALMTQSDSAFVVNEQEALGIACWDAALPPARGPPAKP